MNFPAFDKATIHFVLRGTGHFQVGASPPFPFLPQSVLIIPASERHWVGDGGGQAKVRDAADCCALIGDGLVEFTAGSGADDTLMLCGALTAPYQGGLSFFDLLRVPTAGETVSNAIPASVFEAMADEIVRAGFGTQAMCQALMKQGLVALLRDRETRQKEPGGAMFHPRLAKAVAAVVADPAATHTVGSLASLSGMSRASFSEHFSKAFGQSPIEFVQKTRLRIAARLLRTTDLPIKVIANTAGYAGPRPFARAFQATYERGPAGYRALQKTITSKVEPAKTSKVEDAKDQPAVSDRPDL